MSARLILLGILSWSKKPMHGYKIKKTLEEWAVGEYARISYGSIYYNLDQMEMDGLVKKETVRKGKRPERQMYSLTEKGRAELMELLRRNYSEMEREYYPFDVGVVLMPFLPKEEVIKALDKRIRFKEKELQHLQEEKAELEGKIPFFSLFIFDHYIVHCEAEKKWLEGVREEVERRESLLEEAFA